MRKILAFFLAIAFMTGIIVGKLDASEGKTVTVTDMAKRTVVDPLSPKGSLLLVPALFG